MMNSPSFVSIASVLLALLRPGMLVGQGIDLVELTTEAIQEAYAAGEYTSVDLTKAFLERIDRYEDYYNAFISMNPEALDIAARLDEEYRSSGPRGPLHGVPVVIKDNMDYSGLVTTAGFWGFSTAMGGIDMIPSDDAAAVERLRDAGAIILGKTNLPDFAGHGTRTNSSVAGVTLNPYNVTKAPGGSSGGTATAVNASFAVLGLGTETGGSIQNPSSAQALVGVKPTYGLVPLEGVYPINGSYVDVVGPMAKNVYDAAVTLDIIAGPTTDDFATFAAVDHIPENGYASALAEAAIEGKRFGLVGSGWRERWLPLDPKTETVYREAISTLTDLGAVVIEDPFAGSAFIELYGERPGVPSQGAYDRQIYLQGLGSDAAFHSIEEWEELSGELFGRGGRGRGGQGERRRVPPARPGATEEGDAFQSWRMEIRELFRSIMAEHELDALFFPQAGAPNRDLIEDPERPDYNPNNWPELPSNIINDFGVPVVTVPYAYYEDSTPFVLAFIGDMWTEADLLGYAYIFEQAVMSRRAPELIDKGSN
ncbi:MAG: amidase [Gemmatimonadetes bacterium]|nr:amidase [Gemmatimonadota bacterium]|tara:strand:+ start:2226 stop:3842 length:1617 start_codon:yes stop_codon:yes gene_type:complete